MIDRNKIVESSLNPYYRFNLLNSCIGEELIEIKKFYSQDEYEILNEFSLVDSFTGFRDLGCLILLKFTNQIELCICVDSFFIHVFEIDRNQQSERQNDFYSYDISPFSNLEHLTYSMKMTDFTNDIINSDIIGNKVCEVLLLKDVFGFYKRNPSVYNRRPHSSIAGFSLKFESRSINFFLGGVEIEPIDIPYLTYNGIPKYGGRLVKINFKQINNYEHNDQIFRRIYSNSKRGIIISTSDELIKNDIYKIVDLSNYEIENLKLRGRTDLPVLSDYGLDTIPMNDVLKGTFIDIRRLRAPYSRNIKWNIRNNRKRRIQYKKSLKEILEEIMKIYPEVDFKVQIKFFHRLIIFLTENEVHLAELKLGLNSDYNFVLVEPVDVVPANLRSWKGNGIIRDADGNKFNGQALLLEGIVNYLEEFKKKC